MPAQTVTETRRDTVLRVLREHQEHGARREDFKAAGIVLLRPHIDSLCLEHGLAIESRMHRLQGGGVEQRWHLTLDEWADG